jgi:hypothetical protein
LDPIHETVVVFKLTNGVRVWCLEINVALIHLEILSTMVVQQAHVWNETARHV